MMTQRTLSCALYRCFWARTREPEGIALITVGTREIMMGRARHGSLSLSLSGGRGRDGKEGDKGRSKLLRCGHRDTPQPLRVTPTPAIA